MASSLSEWKGEKPNRKKKRRTPKDHLEEKGCEGRETGGDGGGKDDALPC